MITTGVCMVCGQAGKPWLDGIKDYLLLQGNSPDFDVCCCASCKIAYSMPSMTNEDLAQYYPKEYGPYVPKKSMDGFLQRVKYKSDLALIRKYRGSRGGTLFEIGAGRGEFLHQARTAGFEVGGLEPSEAGVRIARDFYEIRLETNFMDDFNFSSPHDCVVVRHVLEHLNDPMGCLNKIFQHGLKPQGVLLLKLPRLDSWEAHFWGKFWSGFDMPRHRVHFTREGILKILRQVGFREIKIYQEMIPVDFLRDARYYAMHGKPGLLKKMTQIFTALPLFIQLMIASCVGMLLFPFGPARMIILARK